jgi:hypothetical protein
MAEILPPLYAAWLRDILTGPIPAETEATCDSCAMCRKAGEATISGRIYFKPDVKCCTFIPTLPNFLVGLILLDEASDPVAEAGRTSVLNRIADRVAVSPLGLGVPPLYRLLYSGTNQELETSSFGRSSVLRCPHYHQGLCGIWKYRNAVCATWFCKHIRGALGSKFWADSIRPLLAEIENDLSRWCLLKLGATPEMWTALNPARLERLDVEQMDNQINELAYSTQWENWRDHEAELYMACARLVGTLTWRDVRAIGGPEVTIYADLARAAYRQLLDTNLPLALMTANYQVTATDRETTTIVTYSAYDPIVLPNQVFALLSYFNGRSTARILDEIADREGIALDDDLIRRLVDFGLLVGA